MQSLTLRHTRPVAATLAGWSVIDPRWVPVSPAVSTMLISPSIASTTCNTVISRAGLDKK